MTVLDVLAPRIDTASTAELLELFGELATATKYTEMKMQAREIDRATKQAARGGDPKPQADLSTADIATMFGKSPQTVRDWIGNELLDAYRFQGREWRVTPESLQKFVAQQREPLKLKIVGPEPDVGEWRNVSAE